MHAGSSEWVRTHAPPFSRAFVPANDHAPPLVKEISLVVSRSCHFLSLNFQALYFQSLLAHGYVLRRAGVAFRRLANHFPEVVPFPSPVYCRTQPSTIIT